jgi:putative transposase
MVPENIKYCRKIRIYPDKEQKIYFNKCFGSTRFFYNNAIQSINDQYKNRLDELNNLSLDGCVHIDKEKKQCKKNNGNKYYCKKHEKLKIKWNITGNHIGLRKNVMTNDKDLIEPDLWQKDVPYDTRSLAIKNAATAYKSSLALKRNGYIDKFELKYKSAKNNKQMFNIDHRALKLDLRLFTKRLGGKKLRIRRKIRKWWKDNIKNIESDCSIVREKPDRYFLCLPMERPIEEKEDKYDIVSLDPGIRTFQTFYSNNGICGKLGDNMADHLMKIAIKIDKLESFKTKIKNKKTKKNIINRCFKLRTKMKNTIRNLHWQSASYLCKNYRTILLPPFEVKSIAQALPFEYQKIKSAVTRKLLSLSHYAFKQRLLYKSTCYKKTRTIICDEMFTTMTCGGCGNKKKNLKGNHKYECKKCDYKMDRDIHGARNILIKFLSS